MSERSHYWLSLSHPDTQPGQNAAAAEHNWYSRGEFRRYPAKSKVRADIAAVLDGWSPREPIIGESTRVLAMGSCFAANFIEWLASRGFNRELAENPHAAFLRNPFESPAVVAQQLRWAVGEFDPAHAVWYDKSKQLVEPTEDRRKVLRTSLDESDVLIITLGLSEVWYDRVSGEPLWRVLPVAQHDPQRHAFKVDTVAETTDHLETIASIRDRHFPQLRLLYTVSPLRLHATFRGASAVTANCVSKAIIRAALDEFLRGRADLGTSHFYYPSYELVTDVFVDPFTEDQFHLQEHVLTQTLGLLARHYTSLPGEPLECETAPDLERRLQLVEAAYDKRLNALHLANRRCAVLEQETAALREVCEERLNAIHQLSHEAEMLRKVCTERLAVIERQARREAALRRAA